jgi:hypothetical protein
MKRLLSSALALLALVLAPSLTAAQVPCFLGDDGFDAGCCQKPHPNLPDFPGVKVSGVYGCLQKCNLENAFKVDVKLSKLDFTQCDTAVAELNVFPVSAGAPTINAKIIAKYSRTWIDASTGQQVWRFLLNGDWEFGGAVGIAACPVPPHANPSHAIGSIDYACDPTSPFPATQVALNLSHLPGCVSHGPLSARPLGGAQSHRDRSYHLVAPANFTFGVGTDIHGPFFEEAVRYSAPGATFPTSYTCLGEAPVLEGEMASVFKDCLCGVLANGAWVHSRMKGAVACITAAYSFYTVDNFDPVIPTGLAGLRLGRWSGPSWPGDVELTVYTGYMRYENPCADADVADPHRVFGVGTIGLAGYLFNTPSLQPEKVFVDLQDSLVQSAFFPPALKRIFGAPAYASLVWNLNPRP